MVAVAVAVAARPAGSGAAERSSRRQGAASPLRAGRRPVAATATAPPDGAMSGIAASVRPSFAPETRWSTTTPAGCPSSRS
jgi:hypothetical protein